MSADSVSSEGTLYTRRDDYIPRVAAIHDLCGYGKCSLGIAIPVLSAAGCDVCPVPTGLFSNHTQYPTFTMHDTTAILDDYLSAWKSIGVEIDAVYSGFLGSAEQVDIIRGVYETHPNALRVVDPVMADHGKVYPTYTSELCQAMAELAREADILTPNLTEAAIILGREWMGTDIQRAGEDVVRNFVGGAEIETVEVSNELVPYQLHGTGDLYCSALLSAVMAGKALDEAAWFAGELTADAIRVSAKQPHFQQRGVSFETLLGRIAALLG